MTDEELHDALIGLYAYDTGSISAGIHDERLRAKVKAHLLSLDETAFRLTLSRMVRDHWLTEERLAMRYGIEDIRCFIDWMADRMDIDI